MARIARLQRRLGADIAGESEDEPRLVQVLMRGFAVLQAFRPGDASLSNAEIAEKTGLPRPTVSRLTLTLTVLGYLNYLPQLGRYSIGSGVVALCHTLLAHMPGRIAARPIMQDLAERTRLPVSLSMRDQFDMLYIDTARHVASPPARFDLGTRIPIDVTATGRAYLYGLPTDEREALIEAIRQRTSADDWPHMRAEFDRAFESLDRRGFCISFGGWRPDVYAVAAPVMSQDTTVLVMNCGGPPFEVSADRLENEIGPRLAYGISQIATRGSV